MTGDGEDVQDLYVVHGHMTGKDGRTRGPERTWYLRRGLLRDGEVPAPGQSGLAVVRDGGRARTVPVRVDYVQMEDGISYDRFKALLEEDPGMTPRLPFVELASSRQKAPSGGKGHARNHTAAKPAGRRVAETSPGLRTTQSIAGRDAQRRLADPGRAPLVKVSGRFLPDEGPHPSRGNWFMSPGLWEECRAAGSLPLPGDTGTAQRRKGKSVCHCPVVVETVKVSGIGLFEHMRRLRSDKSAQPRYMLVALDHETCPRPTGDLDPGAPLADLPVPTRIVSAMSFRGKRTISDLCAFSEADLRSMRGIGDKTVTETLAFLRAHGARLEGGTR